MPKGSVIPESLFWTVVRMKLCHWSAEDVQVFTEVSPRSQSRIMKRYKATGDVGRPNKDYQFLGRHKFLSADEVAVLTGAVNKNCDIYLDELQDHLQTVTGMASVWPVCVDVTDDVSLPH
ncbi:hypothetical protein OF83DRAFT_1180550 [Amylostereum chailletii]|nr:hypothetical protein OF83DRAFT_1180550 [Amylostereum chailletii]